MKQFWRLTGLITILLTPLMWGAQAFAFSQSITQELTVTAVVPAHRDIILDSSGDIVTITSNTLDDITPDVYTGSAVAENKITLTSQIMDAYRRLVPSGTAQYGVLYQRGMRLVRSGQSARHAGFDLSVITKPGGTLLPTSGSHQHIAALRFAAR